MKKRSIILLTAITIILLLTAWGVKEFGKKKHLYSTNNAEALRHYKAGVNYTLMYYIKEARREFSLAINLDPNFPLPYIYQIMISMGPKETNIAEYYKKIAIPQKQWTDFEKEFTSLFLEFTKKRGKISGDKKFARKLEDFINKYADRIEIYPIILPMYQTTIGDKDKLVEYYRYLHEKFPNNTQILNRLGYLYLEKRDFKNAENCFKKYIFIEPDNANPYDSIADLYFTLGNYKKAIENYKKALNIKPDFYNSKIKLALCYIYTGKLRIAEKMLEEMTKLSSENPYLKYTSYSLKSFIYFSGGEKEKLKKLYENFNPSEKYRCFKIPVNVNFAIMFKDKKLLSQSLKEAENCYKFIKEMVMPFKIKELVWEGKDREAEKIIIESTKKFNELAYDKKVIYAHIISDYYISKKQYEKIKPFLENLQQEDKVYFNLIIAKSQNNKKLCKEFAKKLLEYYNESDDNFYKKKEALECLK